MGSIWTGIDDTGYAVSGINTMRWHERLLFPYVSHCLPTIPSRPTLAFVIGRKYEGELRFGGRHAQ